jgi:hypothetical protein
MNAQENPRVLLEVQSCDTYKQSPFPAPAGQDPDAAQWRQVCRVSPVDWTPQATDWRFDGPGTGTFSFLDEENYQAGIMLCFGDYTRGQKLKLPLSELYVRIIGEPHQMRTEPFTTQFTVVPLEPRAAL